MLKYAEGKFCREEKCVGEERAVWRAEGSVCLSTASTVSRDGASGPAGSQHTHNHDTERLASTIIQDFLQCDIAALVNSWVVYSRAWDGQIHIFHSDGL